MTSLRKSIILLGSVLFAGMGIYPPWVLQIPSVTLPVGSGMVLPAKHRQAGYAFVFSPPQATDWILTPKSIDPLPQEPARMSDGKTPEEDWLSRRLDIRQDELGSVNSRSAEIDWSRLLAQWISLVGLCTGCYCVSGERKSRPNDAAGV